MTKLFTLKNLACAGAMAFAMTLMTAPQADAGVIKLNPVVDYETGELVVGYEQKDDEGATLIETDDGTGIYFGSGNDAAKAAKKMTLVTSDEEDGFRVDISKLFGKAGVIHVAADEKGTGAADATIAAAPTFKKLKLENGDLKYTIGSGDITGDKIGESYYISYKKGAYGEWISDVSNQDLIDVIKSSNQLGTTLYVKVAGYTPESEDKKVAEAQSTPWSKEVKLKVAAKGKAPKVAIKTALTKEFGWKSGDKVEYILTLGEAASEWAPGSKEASNWTKIVENAAAVKKVQDKTDEDGNVTGTEEVASDLEGMIKAEGVKITDYVNGDAVSLPVQLQVRTKADAQKGKPASGITVVKLEASPNSPTYEVIKVEAKASTKKNASTYDVVITPGTYVTGYTGQYSTDGTTWKALKSAVTIDSKKLSSGVVYIRQVCEDKKKSLLASPATKITTICKELVTEPANAEQKTEEKKEKFFAVEATGYVITEGKWVETTDKIYSTADLVDKEAKNEIEKKEEELKKSQSSSGDTSTTSGTTA